MARHESDREDLLAEAVALVRRAEWRLPGFAEPVLLGERDNGWFSIYVGQDLCWQFDAADRFRRAYVAPALYRTQGTTLARLLRDRTSETTVLRRTDLAAAELDEFRAELRSVLSELNRSLELAAVDPLRIVPDGVPGVAAGLVDRLRRLSAVDRTDWLAPAIRGKR